MEDTEDAQDAWTKPATTFKIKRTKSIGRPSFSNNISTKSIGRPSFSNISKQSFTTTSNSVKRMNPFGMVRSNRLLVQKQHNTRWVILIEERLVRGPELKTPSEG